MAKSKIVGRAKVVLLIVLIILVFCGIWLFTGPEGGVRLQHDMEEYALNYLKSHSVLSSSEDLIAYYDVTLKLDGSEAAILTTKRIIYHKKGQNYSIDLSDIQDIKHRKETMVGDVFEIYGGSGKVIKFEIAPFGQGETFKNVLMKAWQGAREARSESQQSTTGEVKRP